MKGSEKSFKGAWVILSLAVISVLLLWSFTKGNESKTENATKAGTLSQKAKPSVNKVLGSGTNGSKRAVSKKPETLPQKEKPKPRPRIVRKRMEPEATRRLAASPQRIRTVLTTSGRAENAKWGVKGVVSFVLNYHVDCVAEILEKKENAVGEIKVVEKRTYNRVRQDLQLSDADVRFAIYDTLPLAKLASAIDAVCMSMMESGEVDSMAVVAGLQGLKKGGAYVANAVDGKSVRGLLEMIGGDWSDEIEGKITEFVNGKVKSIFKPSETEGKSYLITYYQDKQSGAPLSVDFTYADGRPIQTEEEWLILRRANAFIDSNIIPSLNSSPGDTWTVDTSECDCLFDPFVEGSYSGEVVVERKDDDKSGNWMLSLRSGNVSIVSDNGRTTGEINIEGGSAQVDRANHYVKAMVVTGKAAMKNLTDHHLIFNSRIEGICNFRGSLVTEPINK